MTEYILKAAMTKKSTEHNAYCNECLANGKGKSNIKGIRYKCSFREDYDLCEECEAKGTYTEHPMLKIRNPSHSITKVSCDYEPEAVFSIKDIATEFLESYEAQEK